MRKKYKRRPLKKYFFILILFLTFVPLFYLGRKLYRYLDFYLQVRNDRKEMAILRGEIEVLQGRIEAYKRGILLEARARDDLGMIKKGEKVYLLLKK